MEDDLSTGNASGWTELTPPGDLLPDAIVKLPVLLASAGKIGRENWPGN